MNDFNILFLGQLEARTRSLYFWSPFWTQVDARSSINNFVWLLLWVLGSSWCSGIPTSGKTAARAELWVELDCRVFLDGSVGAIMLLFVSLLGGALMRSPSSVPLHSFPRLPPSLFPPRWDLTHSLQPAFTQHRYGGLAAIGSREFGQIVDT